MARQNFKIYRNKYYFKVHNVWETIFIHQFYLKKKKKTEKNLWEEERKRPPHLQSESYSLVIFLIYIMSSNKEDIGKYLEIST